MSLKVSLPCKHVSHTAWLVAAFRAQESARSDAHFRDDLAPKLLGPLEDEYLAGFSEEVRKDSWVLTIRTYYIDQLILKSIGDGIKTTLNLGAGLDTRPYRLSLPEYINWIEADYAKLISYKNEVLANDKSRCKLERISVDLELDSERLKFFNNINQQNSPTLVLTEGLLPYLKENNVSRLAQELFSMSSVKYWVMDIYNQSFLELRHGEINTNASENYQGDVSFEFVPEDIALFLKPFGWEIKDFISWHEGASKLNRFPDINTEAFKADSGFMKSGIALFQKIK